MTNFSELLKSWRNYFNDTQQEFSERIDVSVPLIRLMESKGKVPSDRSIRTISKALGITPDDFLKGPEHCETLSKQEGSKTVNPPQAQNSQLTIEQKLEVLKAIYQLKIDLQPEHVTRHYENAVQLLTGGPNPCLHLKS